MGDDTDSMTAQGGHAGHVEHHNPMAGKIAMWLFLFTEVLLFGTVFIGYAVYLHEYRRDFRTTSHELDKLVGAANTVILLTSSLTMALSIAALAGGRKRRALVMMAVTVLCALMFMGIKSYEWGHKFEHQVYPTSTAMLDRPPGVQVFYGLYFTMTGLHAFHVVAGAVAILFAMRLMAKERVKAGRMAVIENVGLYWHLVDVVWIFLFPLFYLIG
jgi:cytochrome c oxidase subunit 3